MPLPFALNLSRSLAQQLSACCTSPPLENDRQVFIRTFPDRIQNIVATFNPFDETRTLRDRVIQALRDPNPWLRVYAIQGIAEEVISVSQEEEEEELFEPQPNDDERNVALRIEGQRIRAALPGEINDDDDVNDYGDDPFASPDASGWEGQYVSRRAGVDGDPSLSSDEVDGDPFASSDEEGNSRPHPSFGHRVYAPHPDEARDMARR